MSGLNERARGALFALDPACSRDEWVRDLMAYKSAGGDEDTARDWSAQADSFREADFVATWRSISPDGGIKPGTLFKLARDTGWRESRKANGHAKRETLSDFGRDLWAASKRLSGAALDYLDARRCRIPPPDGDLRWHPSLRHPTGYSGAALVALVTHALTAAPMSLHRTWIRADGGKADVEPARLLLAGHRKQGGVIRLWPDESVTHGLAVAEGVETALSLAWACAPVWACIDAGNLKALPVLAGVAALTVAADDDAAGRDAALRCAQRWAAADREVTLTGGSDGA